MRKAITVICWLQSTSASPPALENFYKKKLQVNTITWVSVGKEAGNSCRTPSSCSVHRGAAYREEGPNQSVMPINRTYQKARSPQKPLPTESHITKNTQQKIRTELKKRQILRLLTKKIEWFLWLRSPCQKESFIFLLFFINPLSSTCTEPY